MAKTTGYSQLVCDRCAKTLYSTDNAPEAQSWRSIKRYTADGTEVSRLLCADCYDGYRTLAISHDQAFGDYMANKGE